MAEALRTGRGAADKVSRSRLRELDANRREPGAAALDGSGRGQQVPGRPSGALSRAGRQASSRASSRPPGAP